MCALHQSWYQSKSSNNFKPVQRDMYNIYLFRHVITSTVTATKLATTTRTPATMAAMTPYDRLVFILVLSSEICRSCRNRALVEPDVLYRSPAIFTKLTLSANKDKNNLTQYTLSKHSSYTSGVNFLCADIECNHIFHGALSRAGQNCSSNKN